MKLIPARLLAVLLVCAVAAVSAPANAASPQEPFGGVDATLGTTASGKIVVSGWALSEAPIDHIVIWTMEYPWGIEQNHGSAGYGLARPDVTALYPNYPNSAGPGWSAVIDSRLLPNTKHQVNAMAVDVNGKRHRFPAQKVTFANSTDNTAPIGGIDFPSAGAVLSGVVEISGWTLDESGVWGDGVGVLVSGHWFVSPIGGDGLAFGHPTPQLVDAYAGYPDAANGGWSYVLNTHMLADGEYTLRVYGKGTTMGTTTIGEIPITVDNSGNGLAPQILLKERALGKWTGDVAFTGVLIGGEIAAAKLLFPGFGFSALGSVNTGGERGSRQFSTDFSVKISARSIPEGCYQPLVRITARDGQINQLTLGTHCVTHGDNR